MSAHNGVKARKLPVQQEAPWVLATGLGLGVLTFFLTDLLLTRLETIYRRKLGGKEKK